jgi:hypothetical protein
MTAGQVIAIILLFPFLPVLTSSLSLTTQSIPSTVKQRSIEVMILPGAVSSLLQMVLVLHCFWKGIVHLSGKF